MFEESTNAKERGRCDSNTVQIVNSPSKAVNALLTPFPPRFKQQRLTLPRRLMGSSFKKKLDCKKSWCHVLESSIYERVRHGTENIF
jgi:hypothetical protein